MEGNVAGLSGGHRFPLATGAVLVGRCELLTALAYSGCGWLRDLPRFAGTDAHGHPTWKLATVRELPMVPTPDATLQSDCGSRMRVT